MKFPMINNNQNTKCTLERILMGVKEKDHVVYS